MPIKYISENLATGFALFVDLNGFTKMTALTKFEDMAQFTGDVFWGAITIVEKFQGEVIALTGDGFLALIPEGEKIYSVCECIAKDVNKQCEYFSDAQKETKGEVWGFCPGGPSIKIGIEFGFFEVSEVPLRMLGKQKLFIGPAINHASRVLKDVVGNECRIGPVAASKDDLKNYPLSELRFVKGKKGEPAFSYHQLDLGDIWIEGPRKRGVSYWD